MLLLLLAFPLLTIIISTQFFIYPFIASWNPSPLYLCVDLCVVQVSRLILNLLEANCFLDENIDSSTMESLRFRHTESTRDTETGISQGNRRVTSLDEEIHEEARWWIEHSALFILVDDVRHRCNNHFFLFISHHMISELWWMNRVTWYQQDGEIIQGARRDTG